MSQVLKTYIRVPGMEEMKEKEVGVGEKGKGIKRGECV